MLTWPRKCHGAPRPCKRHRRREQSACAAAAPEGHRKLRDCPCQDCTSCLIAWCLLSCLKRLLGAHTGQDRSRAAAPKPRAPTPHHKRSHPWISAAGLLPASERSGTQHTHAARYCALLAARRPRAAAQLEPRDAPQRPTPAGAAAPPAAAGIRFRRHARARRPLTQRERRRHSGAARCAAVGARRRQAAREAGCELGTLPFSCCTFCLLLHFLLAAALLTPVTRRYSNRF